MTTHAAIAPADQHAEQGPAAVVRPDGPWCQRWRERRHSWRHTGEGGFDPSRYEVGLVDDRDGKVFSCQHHYSGTWPAVLHRFGLYEVGLLGRRHLVGVAAYAAPVSAAVLTKPFPTLRPYLEAVELARLVLLDDVPANAESWMVARTFRALSAHGIYGVVSFADPVPRQALDGTVTLPGHHGGVYQALNATYAGRGTARTLMLLPDGTTLNARALQKVRRQEQGHQYVEARLHAEGAEPRKPAQPPNEWLSQALEQARVRRLRHPGVHRYLFRLGDRRKRRATTLGLATWPYPKA